MEAIIAFAKSAKNKAKALPDETEESSDGDDVRIEEGDVCADLEDPLPKSPDSEAEDPCAEAPDSEAEDPCAEAPDSEADDPCAEAPDSEADDPCAEAPDSEADDPCAELPGGTAAFGSDLEMHDMGEDADTVLTKYSFSAMIQLANKFKVLMDSGKDYQFASQEILLAAENVNLLKSSKLISGIIKKTFSELLARISCAPSFAAAKNTIEYITTTSTFAPIEIGTTPLWRPVSGAAACVFSGLPADLEVQVHGDLFKMYIHTKRQSNNKNIRYVDWVNLPGTRQTNMFLDIPIQKNKLYLVLALVQFNAYASTNAQFYYTQKPDVLFDNFNMLKSFIGDMA